MSNTAISVPRSSENTEKFVVRLPKGMRKHIADLAYDHHRSMNSEIVSRLERSILIDQSIGQIDPIAKERVVLKENGRSELQDFFDANDEVIIRHLSNLPPLKRQAVLTVLFSIK
ncbi:MAG: hypothetical protein COB04_03790 [Gammaproteobacteria bacterium]|nr:MAG: hypothetical protein COB04_03790 [Gammaproteobacteria bacterium]